MVCFIYGNIHISKSDLNSKLSGLNFFSKNFKLKLPTYPKTKILQNIIIKHPSLQEKNNFIAYYYYIGKFKLNLYIYMLLFNQIYNQYFFDYLRTKEQLGYLVKLQISVFGNDYYISEKVQSNYNIKFIQQKMKEFNKSLFTYLDSIDFEKNLLALKYDIKFSFLLSSIRVGYSDIFSSKYNKTGSVIAPIIGGNLTVLHTLLGSKTSIDTRGKILFIEDIGEYKYHIDRMLQSLKRAGYFDNCKGLLVGDMTKLRKNTTLWGSSVEQLILDALSDYHFPIAFNMPAGHEKDNRAMILGRTINLNVSKEQSTLVFEN